MKAQAQTRSLLSGFVESVRHFPERKALAVAGEAFTYADLGRRAARIASTITIHSRPEVPLAGLLAERSLTAYAGCLGILGARKGYVPLNVKLPPERLLKLIELSGVETIIAGQECLPTLEALLQKTSRSLIVVVPDLDDPHHLQANASRHRLIGADQLGRATADLHDPVVAPDAIAYLLFTSGSTGEPKGVGVTHANAAAYLRNASTLFQITEHDRFSQQFDMSFDLSVHDMFLCWRHGACLYSVPAKAVMGPAKFIQQNQLTCWFSVPSTIGCMLRMRMLKPSSFPFLRYSLFCGEPLPATYAEAWRRAAPELGRCEPLWTD